MKVGVVFSGRGYDAAAGLPAELTLPEGASLDDALQALGALLPADRPLPGTCLIAVGGAHVGTVASHPPRPLADGDELVLVAPVAGG